MKVEKNIRKNWIFIIVIAIIAMIGILISFIHYQRTYFTVEKWNTYSWNERQLLIKSFLKQYDLTQITKDEIIDLLGYDTAYGNDYAIPNKTEDNLVYDFGLQKNAKATNIALIISLDDSEHVTSYELRTYSQ